MKKGFLNSKSDNPFQGLKHLTKIDIPNDVKSIPDNSFFQKLLVIPDSVTNIAEGAFKGLTIETIVAPERFHDQIRHESPNARILTKAQALQEGILKGEDPAQAGHNHDTSAQSGPRP